MTYRLILGDCLEIMPTLTDKIDAVITDPPYGINIISGGGRGMNGWSDFRQDGEWDTKAPTWEYFDMIENIAKVVVIWGGNYFTNMLSVSSGWLVWNKGQRNFSLADGELAWTNQNKALRIFDYSRGASNQETKYHPTQKPVALMQWCIDLFTEPGDTILDPFMGSGTTGVACINLGRNFIGIEKDPGYFAIAERRIMNAQEPLFTE